MIHPMMRFSLVVSLLVLPPSLLAADVRIGPDKVFLIDGTRSFPIGFTTAPPPDGKTPDGRDAYAGTQGDESVRTELGQTHLAFSVNSATDGGGIFNEGGTLTVTN